MHIRFLKIFCDVVDRRSFSRAADDNGISQSSASQAVHQLEERLGVQLLDRSTRPFVVTAEGRRFYDGCRQIVRQYEQLEQDVRALHDADARRLVVACIYSVGLHHMRALVERFSAEHPRAEVRVEYFHPHRVCEEVANGDADLGIVSYAKQTDELAAIPWRIEPLVLATHPEHRLAINPHDAFQGNGDAAKVPLTELDGESFVAFESGLEIRRAIDRMLAKQGVAINVALEFDNVETIKRAIEINAGVSLLPEPSIRREIEMGTLAQVQLEGEPLERPLGILYRRDRALSELCQQFVDMLRVDAQRATQVDGPSAARRQELEARA